MTGVLVGLSGRPGVGKSTVAKALAAATGALWLRVDAIEQAMRDSHMDCADLADGGYAALRAVAEGALVQGHDVIADAVAGEAVTRVPLAAVATRCEAVFLPVAMVCSDPLQHRARVEQRRAEVPGLSLPDWPKAAGRAWAPWPEAVQIDTARMTVAQAVTLLRTEMDRRRAS